MKGQIIETTWRQCIFEFSHLNLLNYFPFAYSNIGSPIPSTIQQKKTIKNRYIDLYTTIYPQYWLTETHPTHNH